MEQSKPKRLRVFLCHASDDKPLARILSVVLNAAGADPWLDEAKLVGGQNWPLEIEKALRMSHAVIVCLSHNSVSKSGFVQKEIRLALDVADEQPEGSIFLIPLRIDDSEIPQRLKKLQWINFLDDQENGIYLLFEALERRASSLDLAIPSIERIEKATDLLNIPELGGYGFEPKTIMFFELITLNSSGKFDLSESRLETYMDAYADDYQSLYLYLDDLLENHQQNDRVIRIVSKRLSARGRASEWTGRLLKLRGAAKLRRWFRETRTPEDLLAAKRDLIKSLKHNADLTESHLHLGLISALQGNLPEADRHFVNSMKTSTRAKSTLSLNEMRKLLREDPERFLSKVKNFYH